MAEGVAGSERVGLKRLLVEEIAYGRADRVDFLRGLGLMVVLLVITGVTFWALFAFAEGLSADGAVTGVALVAQLVGFTLAGTLAVFFGTFAFAFANLIAKRARDLGLPGWKALAVATALGTAFSLGTPFASAAVYVAAVWLVLLLVPSARRR